MIVLPTDEGALAEVERQINDLVDGIDGGAQMTELSHLHLDESGVVSVFLEGPLTRNQLAAIVKFMDELIPPPNGQVENS